MADALLNALLFVIMVWIAMWLYEVASKRSPLLKSTVGI